MKAFVSWRPLAAGFATLASLWFVPSWPAAEIVGQRPYEMVWAHRTNDSRPPLVDFENLDGWTVTATEAVASFTISREQQLWGEHVGRLTYRAGGKSPRVTVQPPRPVPVPAPFDSISLWVYGNNWAWEPDPATPPVEITVLLRSRQGRPVPIQLGSVRWREWWLMHHKLSADQEAQLKEGALFVGLEITNGHNQDDRVIYFDNLAVYKETLPPLRFPPRRKRGVDPFPGQSAGINTGPGRLPFPTREETILPDNLTKDFKVTLAKSGGVFVFAYRGRDGELEYRYEPKTGTLGDVSARWNGRGGPFQPMAGGGVFFVAGDKSVPPDKLQLLQCERLRDTVVSRWRCTVGNRTAEVAYTFRLWQKSLVVDVKCLGGGVGEFRIGQALGLGQPRLVTLPYMGFAGTRPAVVVAGPPGEPLFLFRAAGLLPLQRLGIVGPQPSGRWGDLQWRLALSAEDQRGAQRLLRAALRHCFAALRGSVAEYSQSQVAVDGCRGRETVDSRTAPATASMTTTTGATWPASA